MDDCSDVGYYIDVYNLVLTSNVENYASIEFNTQKNHIKWYYLFNNNNNILILYSAKSMYSSKRFTIKRCDIASLKLIRNVKCAINIQYSG